MRVNKSQAKANNQNLHDDSDSPWKEIIELMFPAFVSFFFPKAYDAIDWSHGYKFLDNEFRKIMRDAEQINRRVDKLVQVYLKSGEEVWILLHIEIQGYRDPDFPKRMFVSWYRIYEKYDRNIISLAILSDDDASWKPTGFRQVLLETRVSHDYRTVQLLDYRGKETELETNANPVAIIVLAHLDMLATKNNPTKRLPAKLNRIGQLYDRGLTRKEVVNLFKFIDWMLTLPQPKALVFEETLSQIEKEKKMPYISSVERRAMDRGREEGMEEGLRESILDYIEVRFNVEPAVYREKLKGIQDLERLRFYESELSSPRVWHCLTNFSQRKTRIRHIGRESMFPAALHEY